MIGHRQFISIQERIRRGYALALLFTAVLLVPYGTSAQDLHVNGGFLSDSLKIGEQTAFYLAIHYPPEQTVLFPDSTFSFFPFEYQQKKYYPTETNDGVSVDSVVYYLTTFEVERTQYLDLPVFVVQQQDCTVIRSMADSVLITQMVAAIPDSITIDKLPLKMNTAYQPVHFQFNFWMMAIVLAALVIAAVIVWIFFGKNIAKYFKAKKLVRNHTKFVAAYTSLLSQLQSAFSPNTTESALSAWKKYLEQLESKPFTKLTTQETMKLLPDEQLAVVLRTVDRAIYGHDTTVIESLENLKHFADRRFSEKLEQVKHGK